jgi:hypothetical protein
MKPISFLIRGSLVLAALGFFVPAGYSAQTKDELLDLLPADTLICFRLNNFTGTLEKMDQYLAGVSPMPVSMTFTMFLGGALGDPMLNGVNKYGTIAGTVLPKGTDEEPVLVIWLPAADPKAFLSSPYCQGSDENGIYTLSAPGSSIGPVALLPLEGTSYLMLGPAEQKEMLLFARTVFKEKKQSLAARLSPADAQNASSAPVWFWLNIEKGYSMLGPEWKSEIQDTLQSAAMDEPMPFKPELFSALLDGIDAWLTQVVGMSLMLSPTAEQLTAEVLFAAKADSELAKVLVRDPAMKQGFSMGGYLDGEAPIQGLFVMNKRLQEQVNKMFLEVFLPFAGEKAPDLRSRFEKISAQGMKALGQEAAFSFGYNAGTPPFSFQETIEITDAATMREMMQEGWDLVNEIYGNFGFPVKCTLQEKAAQYKGVPIDQAVIQFAFPESASEQEKKLVETMYGKEGLKYPFAITEKRMFVAFGPQAEQSLQKMIDLPANAPVPAQMQAALRVIPNAQTADAVFSLNFVRLMSGLGGMMETMASSAGGQVPPVGQMMQSISVPTQSSMAVGVRADGGRIQTHVVLPKQHLMEIMSWSMQLQQRIMMQQFQQQPSSTPPAESSSPSGSPL